MRTKCSIIFRSVWICILLLPFNNALAGPDNPASYEVTLSSAILQFKVKLMGILSLTGEFKDITGSVAHAGMLESPEFNITVSVASLDTRDEARDRFLRSAAFFDADRFPTIRFNRVRLALHEEGRQQLIGEMTLHGESQEVSFEVFPVEENHPDNPAAGGGYAARATINRSEFGLDGLWMVASDKVEITVYVDNDVIELLKTRNSLYRNDSHDLFSHATEQADPLSVASPLSLR